MNDLGSYLEVDGRPAVRFVRTYRHPVERVWTAISDPDELQNWFPTRVEIEPRTGGTIALADDPHAQAATRAILVSDPPPPPPFTRYTAQLHPTQEPAR